MTTNQSPHHTLPAGVSDETVEAMCRAFYGSMLKSHVLHFGASETNDAFDEIVGKSDAAYDAITTAMRAALAHLPPPSAHPLSEAGAVQVTAADYNGQNFDGRPLDWGAGEMPEWLKRALEGGSIKVEPDDRDYAVWRVLIGDNEHRIAEPGDFIVYASGDLAVMPSDPTKAGGHWPDGSGLTRDGEGAAEEPSPPATLFALRRARLDILFQEHYWDSLQAHRDMILYHVRAVLNLQRTEGRH